ncbi:hypothetical protein BS50DRAFT_616594 [Corynespora cassiicola Philippines]|uniref:Uncharacterized protein n=1 Tax=Corynespora cassiicola Philippines TaxID=1448308 RepID=A0A2T2P633_CORCC|nr:hypothetical protein BS50DRAFT_616594 [Corynespora cassiicola Philippines]
MAALPVILCGKTEQIGAGAITHLKPEFEVVHFVLTPEGGKAQIPAILRGEKEVQGDSTLGTKNFEKVPVAIFLGGGYSDDDIESMRISAKNIKDVPWLRPDLTKPAPPLGPEYGKAMVLRIKETMAELVNQGKFEGNGEVVRY